MFLDLIVWLIVTSFIGTFSLPIFNRVSNNSNLSGYFISIPLFLIIGVRASYNLFIVWAVSYVFILILDSSVSFPYSMLCSISGTPNAGHRIFGAV